MSEENENVCVFCRLKPLNNEIIEPCIKFENMFTVCTVPPDGCRRNTKEMTYTFTEVFRDTCSQSEVFNDVAFPLIKDLLNEKNGLLFAYGVTGSGKTFTMQGTNENPGIVSRTIKALFRRINFIKRFRIRPDDCNTFKVFNITDALIMHPLNQNDYSRRSGNHECKVYMSQVEDDPFEMKRIDNCTVFISMVEIYGNNIRDLLKGKHDNSSGDVTIKKDRKNVTYLHNVKEVEVQKAEEALYWYMKGQKRRKTASTNLNNQSSRSHCVFNIRLVKLDVDRGDEYSCSKRPSNSAIFNQQNSSNVAGVCNTILENTKSLRIHNLNKVTLGKSGDCLTVNQLALVDLAGSERAKRTGTSGVQLKEASDINNSLMDLRMIFKMLRDKNRANGVKFINYRANALTHMFKTSLEGNSNVRMIVCVQQMPEEYDETLNVLTFAEDTKEITITTNDNLYTPKVTKLPPKSVTKDVTDPTYDETLLKLEEMINTNLLSAERYRMIQPKEQNNDHEMMITIMNILDILYKMQHSKDQLTALLSSCEVEDSSDKMDSLNCRLNTERLENKCLKRRLKEAEVKLMEKDKEIVYHLTEISNLNKTKMKQDDKIKLLEETLKRKNEELGSILKQKTFCDLTNKSKRDSLKSIRNETVKVLTQKFEDVSSNKNKSTILASKNRVIAPISNNNRRGFFNRYYRRSKSNDLYLEHKEKHEVPGGTLNKLNIKTKRRSSTKIKLEDLKKSDRYILQDQTVVGDEYRVDYHIGDIIPTAGGGVAIQYTNIETIKQHSPFTHSPRRKRHSSVPSDVDENNKKYIEDLYYLKS